MNTDRRTVQLVVLFLGLVALAVIVGVVYLVAVGRSVPEGLWTLAGGATGALAALLAKTGTEPPAQINVTTSTPAPA